MSIVIGLIDYGMGNLYSVNQAFNRLNKLVIPITNPSHLDKCNALVLPGVGSFDPAMENLTKTKLIPHIKHWADEGKPFLGICLGLQLLFESSEEGKHKGLGMIKGRVKRLPNNQKERIPHMGWSELKKVKNCPLLEIKTKQNWMYFVHSYSAIVEDKQNLSATVSFGDLDITAIVWKDNIGACQFHPEKSGKEGERMLSNWLKWLEKLN